MHCIASVMSITNGAALTVDDGMWWCLWCDTVAAELYYMHSECIWMMTSLVYILLPVETVSLVK